MKTKTLQINCELRYKTTAAFFQKKADIAAMLTKEFPQIQQDDLNKIIMTNDDLTISIGVSNNSVVFTFAEDTDYLSMRRCVESVWNRLSNILNIQVIDRLGIRMMELYNKNGIEAFPAISSIFGICESENIIEANCNFVYKFGEIHVRVITSNHIHQKFDVLDQSKNYQINGTLFDIDSFKFKVLKANLAGEMQDLIQKKDLVLGKYE